LYINHLVEVSGMWKGGHKKIEATLLGDRLPVALRQYLPDPHGILPALTEVGRERRRIRRAKSDAR
jgi:hypothetical protein